MASGLEREASHAPTAAAPNVDFLLPKQTRGTNGPNYDELSQHPADSLKRYARDYWFQATLVRAAERQGLRAVEDAKHALALDEKDETLSIIVPPLLACGRYSDAANLMASHHGPGTHGKYDPVLLTLSRTLIAAHDGKWNDVARLSSKLASLGHQYSSAKPKFAKVMIDSALWLGLSSAFVLHKADTPDTNDATNQAISRWRKLVETPEATRSRRRWDLPLPTHELTSPVLPALLYVMSEAAPKNAETWLDSRLPVLTDRRDTDLMLRARAEAARWRGDAKAEKLWNQRASQLEEFLATPRGRVLATLAGL